MIKRLSSENIVSLWRRPPSDIWRFREGFLKLPEIPKLTNAELVQLRIRVIALENLVIALLAEASDRQLHLAREMAAYISPRPGFTDHPLTVHAATQMTDLVERSGHFRVMAPS